jgi:hypothetical protein
MLGQLLMKENTNRFSNNSGAIQVHALPVGIGASMMWQLLMAFH